MPHETGASRPADAGELIEQTRQAYGRAVFETDKVAAHDVLLRALDEGVSAEALVFGVVVPSLRDVCETGAGEVSLAQHFMASLIACEATDELVRRFAEPSQTIGRVVIGTARGDFHGLGARIVAGCLQASMIEVVDLGRDVEPRRFIDEALAGDADVICISSMMLHTALGGQGPSAVRRLLDEAGLSDQIKLVVGGAPYNHDPALWQRVGADAWADDGLAAGPVVTGLLQKECA
jgi:trimethylamine corrinoid protein